MKEIEKLEKEKLEIEKKPEKDIHSAIIAVQKKIKCFSALTENKSVRKKYASYYDVFTQIMDVLHENNLCVFHQIDGDKLKTKIYLAGTDIFIESVLNFGFEEKNSMMKGMKLIGAEITYAKRYNLLSLLGLPEKEFNEDNLIEEQQKKEEMQAEKKGRAEENQIRFELYKERIEIKNMEELLRDKVKFLETLANDEVLLQAQKIQLQNLWEKRMQEFAKEEEKTNNEQ